jgi:mRNA interferase MazF
MPFTTTYKRGDVVLVPFPFTDLSSSKHRPALIVSPDALNSARDDVVVLDVTSQIPRQLTADEFMIPAADLRSTGLPKPSLPVCTLSPFSLKSYPLHGSFAL